MRTAALLAALLLLAGPGFALAIQAPTPTTNADWRLKADLPLLEAFDAGQGTLKVGFTGPRIPVEAGMFEDREDWKAFVQAQSATFLQGMRQRVEALGGEVTAEIRYANTLYALVPNAKVPELVARPDVRRASLDWQGATYILGDFSVPEAPGLQAVLVDTIAKVQAQDMWALGFRGEGIKLAMIDTGVRGTHEMLKNADGTSRVIGWHDTTEPASGRCATPCDTHSHGTHVSTTAAGSNLFNPNSQQGVAPRADIIGVRIFQGGGGSWEDAQEGLQGAFDLGAEITSNSWGGGCSGGGITTAELAEDLQEMGMMNVFAAGNSGAGGVICPGMVDNVITVAAIDINEVIAGFSSRGPCVWPVGSGNSRICPDVSAVGVDVVAGCHSSDTCYTSMSGTSMATPHVGGVVALLQQAHKAAKGGQGMDAAKKQAEVLLRYTAKDLGTAGPDNNYGWGLAKAKDARALLLSGAAVDLRDLFSVGKAELRSYESNNLLFSVVNLGSVDATGTLLHKVEQISWGACPPACDTVVIKNGPLGLNAFTESSSSYNFDGAAHPAGTYKVTARLDYTYVDPIDGLTKSGSLERVGFFLVKKVYFVKSTNVPGNLAPGEVVFGATGLVNLGNENATNVVLRMDLPTEGIAPLPVADPGEPPTGIWANPAPTDFELARTSTDPRTRYTWNIGTVNSLTDWDVTYNLAGGAPGNHAVINRLSYLDETGRAFSENFDVPVVVGLGL